MAHPEHLALLAEPKAVAPPPPGPPARDSYGGSGHPYFSVGVPERRAIARAWLRSQRDTPPGEILAVVDSLFAGESHEEKTLPGFILAGAPVVRRAVAPDDMYRWLGLLNGWAEIDGLCQSVFTAADMSADWPAWKALIERLAVDPDINRRRASLVLLNAPVRTSDDPSFRDLVLWAVERVQAERDILITKAVSWSLRSMIGRHRQAVVDALGRWEATLPKVALRETRLKLETGAKSGRVRTGIRA